MSSTMSGFLLKLLFKSNKNFDSTTRNTEHETLPPNFKLFKLFKLLILLTLTCLRRCQVFS